MLHTKLDGLARSSEQYAYAVCGQAGAHHKGGPHTTKLATSEVRTERQCKREKLNLSQLQSHVRDALILSSGAGS